MVHASQIKTEEKRAERYGYNSYTIEEIKKMDDNSLVIIAVQWKKDCPNIKAKIITAAEDELKKRHPVFFAAAKQGKILVGMPEYMALMAWPRTSFNPDTTWTTSSGERRQFSYRYRIEGIPITYKWFVTQNGKVTMFEESRQ